MRLCVRRLVLVLALLSLTGSPSPASAEQGLPPCLGALVPVAQGTSDGRSHFVLRQTSSSACRVPSHPLVSLSSDGRRVPVRVALEPEAPATASAVPPGALVSFSVSALGRGCRPADTVRVRSSADDDGVSFGGAAVPACPGGRLSVSAFRTALPAMH